MRVVDAFADDDDRASECARRFARGDFATWGYDDAYARRAADPGTLLPEARSVVCVAVPYATPAPRAARRCAGAFRTMPGRAITTARLRALLARVARGDRRRGGRSGDGDRLRYEAAGRARLRRARRARLDRQAHESISPALGSFVFLGEIVTTLDLPADAPLRKTCGACARCVEACPTRALRGDYTIDANRCISDLTQRTDAIPRDDAAVRSAIGSGAAISARLVCPPTQRAGDARRRATGRRSTRSGAPVAARAAASAQRRRSSGAFATPRWAGAARRCCAATRRWRWATRSTARRSARWSQQLDDDPHPMVRGHAAWALGRIGSPARSRLCGAPWPRDGRGVREEIGMALTFSAIEKRI